MEGLAATVLTAPLEIDKFRILRIEVLDDATAEEAGLGQERLSRNVGPVRRREELGRAASRLSGIEKPKTEAHTPVCLRDDHEGNERLLEEAVRENDEAENAAASDGDETLPLRDGRLDEAAAVCV